MRLRCRVGIHLIEWGYGYYPIGECVYCRQRFQENYDGHTNLSRAERREDRRQAKIDAAKENAGKSLDKS